MNSEDPRVGQLLLLGKDYGVYGAVETVLVGSQSAAVISVGSDDQSPSGQFKFDPLVANEDALCVRDAGSWVGLAVADAHYGPESSHVLINGLHRAWTKEAPTDGHHLAAMVEQLSRGDRVTTHSECTLLAVVFDRVTGTGFGVSFGDSTCVVIKPGHLPTPINIHDHRFVTPAAPRSLRRGRAFSFSADPGDVLVVYTDGIDGCHYRHAATSVQPHHIAAIAERVNYDPLGIVTGVTELALEGIDGNPGGQDNIVMVASTI